MLAAVILLKDVPDQGWIQRGYTPFECATNEFLGWSLTEPQLLHGSGAQEVSSTTVAHPFLCSAVEFSGEAERRERQQQQCSTPGFQSLMKAGTLARPHPDKLVNSELTAHVELKQEPALTRQQAQSPPCMSSMAKWGELLPPLPHS